MGIPLSRISTVDVSAGEEEFTSLRAESERCPALETRLS